MNFIMEEFSKKCFGDVDILAARNQNQILALPMSPALDAYTAYLHEDMRQAYLSGLDHAAIVTACALLEFTLKEAVYSRCHFLSDRQFDQSKWDEVESKDFAQILSWAKSLGLVSKEAGKALDSFRDSVRNHYLHGSTPDPVKSMKWQVFEGKWETGEGKVREIELCEDLSLQRIGRLVFDRMQCNSVVLFVDKAVRDFLQIKQQEIAKWDADHPRDKPTREQLDHILKRMKSSGFEGDMVVMRDIPDDIAKYAERA